MLVCLLGALLSNVPLFFLNRLFCSQDLNAYYRWADQFARAVSEGTWRPRWESLGAGGLGTPSFLHVAPLFFYAVSLAKRFTGDVWSAMRLVAFVAAWGTGLVAWRGLRRRVPDGWALAGAVSLQFNPFVVHTLNLHNLFPFSTVMPILVWFILASADHRGRAINFSLVIGMALLALTHQLAVLIAGLTVPFVFLPRLFREGRGAWAEGWSWGVSCLLGLGLAGYQLVPALAVARWLPATDFVEPFHIDWRNSFILPFWTAARYGTRWAGVQWGLGGLAVLGLAVLGVGVWRSPPEHRPAISGFAAVSAAACFLAWEGSFLLWQWIRPVQMASWPYRFLLGALPAGLLGLAVLAGRSRENLLRLAAVAALALGPLMSAGLQFKSLKVAEAPDFATMPVQDYRRLQVPGDEWKDYLRKGGLPAECAARAVAMTQGVNFIHRRDWTFDAARDTVLRLPVFYFPSWRVTVDGRPVRVRSDERSGLLAVDVPAGRHEVSLRWAPGADERTGWGASLAALLVTALAAARRRARAGDQESVSTQV